MFECLPLLPNTLKDSELCQNMDTFSILEEHFRILLMFVDQTSFY